MHITHKIHTETRLCETEDIISGKSNTEMIRKYNAEEMLLSWKEMWTFYGDFLFHIFLILIHNTFA